LGLQPGEQIIILRSGKIARQRFIEMMVSVNKTWRHDLSGKIDYRVGRRREFFVPADLFDDTVLGVQAGAF
jgi:hypothetical protein